MPKIDADPIPIPKPRPKPKAKIHNPRMPLGEEWYEAYHRGLVADGAIVITRDNLHLIERSKRKGEDSE